MVKVEIWNKTKFEIEYCGNETYKAVEDFLKKLRNVEIIRYRNEYGLKTTMYRTNIHTNGYVYTFNFTRKQFEKLASLLTSLNNNRKPFQYFI